MDSISDPRPLLGHSPSATSLLEYLEQLARIATKANQIPAPEVKAYSDTFYQNYYPLGLSLMFVAKDGSQSIKNMDSQSGNFVLDGIDIYNTEPEETKTDSSTSSPAQTYAPYPAHSLVLSLLPSIDNKTPRQGEIVLTPSSTGKDVLRALGEPDRKGGGVGPSSGSIGIWCEWAKDGIMVEFGGLDSRGPLAWERGKDARWRVLTLFRSKA